MTHSDRTPAARTVLPEFHERTPQGVRRLDPWSKLLEGRIVLLGTAVDDIAVGDVITQLLQLEYAAPERDISLYINAPGGSLDAVMAIHDTLQAITCTVETVCVGQVAGAAALLLAAGAPGRRLMLPTARITLRQPSLAEPLHGQPSDLEIHTAELLRQRGTFTALLARYTGRDPERVTAELERPRHLTAAQALEYGLVDQVIRTRGAGARGAASA
ncbi:ATP-dependent Clp protease proteolytic subunit [Streptomyces sp. NPDC000594]|uniref:ATP-dependent Clp protease proteolytic subunit n=1 Tax=Streptomyces sp. NPDC000594 TaxID=3154261 RepID=UPI0033171456